jgi:hypothetical protein
MNLWSGIINRVRLTRWIREAKKVASLTLGRYTNPNVLALIEAIVQRSLACVEALDDKLRNSSPSSHADYLQRRLQAFYDCVSFLRHAVACFVFAELGEHRMKELVDDVLPPLLVEFTVDHFYKTATSSSIPKDLDPFKQRFYDYLNSSDREYASCKVFMLRPEEDSSYEPTTGAKGTGKLNLLVQKILGILNDHRPNTYVQVMEILMSTTDLQGLEPIAVDAGRVI